MDNLFLKQQVNNMKSSVILFENACQLAVTKDDEAISKTEKKALIQIKKANKKYIDSIMKILNY